MLEHVLQNARARGYITDQEVLELYPEPEESVLQIDEFIADLFDQGIALMRGQGRDSELATAGAAPPAETADAQADEEVDTDIEPTCPPTLRSSCRHSAQKRARWTGWGSPWTWMDLSDDTVSLYLKQMGQVSLLTAPKR